MSQEFFDDYVPFGASCTSTTQRDTFDQYYPDPDPDNNNNDSFMSNQVAWSHAPTTTTTATATATTTMPRNSNGNGNGSTIDINAYGRRAPRTCSTRSPCSSTTYSTSCWWRACGWTTSSGPG